MPRLVGAEMSIRDSSCNQIKGKGREYEPERVFTTVKLLELSADTLETSITIKKANTRTIKNVLGFI